MELETLITEIEQRIENLKEDYSLSVDVKDALVRENTKFLVRTQQLFMDSELFCKRMKNQIKNK